MDSSVVRERPDYRVGRIQSSHRPELGCRHVGVGQQADRGRLGRYSPHPGQLAILDRTPPSVTSHPIRLTNPLDQISRGAILKYWWHTTEHMEAIIAKPRRHPH